MKFLEIFRFEVRLQSRRVSTWLFFAVLLGFVYRLTTEGYIGIARNGGFLFNGPFVIASITLATSLLGLLVAAALAGDAAARDVQTNMHPLFYSAPVSRSAYLGGRLLGAFAVSAAIVLAAPIALLLATLSPGLEPELLGPFRPDAYLAAYVLLALPNAFVATALMFAIAVFSRRAMASYVAGVLLFLGSVLTSEFLAGELAMWNLAKVLDPFGMIALREFARVSLPAEKSTVLIGLQSSFVVNRLAWLGVALGVLALTRARFRFAHPVARGWWQRAGRRRRAVSPAPSGATGAAAAGAGAMAARGAPITVPRVRPTFGPAARARQVLAVASQSLRHMALGWGGLVVAGMMVFLIALLPSLISHMGVPLLPVTAEMAAWFSSDDLLWLFIPLLTVFYAGELVWRDRDDGLSEIADAVPVPEWVPFLGKLLGLAAGLLALQVLMVVTAMLVQARMGYVDFQLGLYARTLFPLQLVEHLLFAVLALVVHVLVNHKYVGHMVVLVAYALVAFAPALGVEHEMLVYGSGPGWSYSDMRGFGGSLAPWLWFKLYWAAWALLLAVLARLLWVRGRETGLGSRLRLARGRLTRPAVGGAALALALVLTLGGFVFYNTNVLNEYRPAADYAERRAQYERRYGRYADAPQPLVTGTRLRVEIHPDRRRADIRGSHRLVNRHALPIDTIHVATASAVETTALGFDRPASRVLADDDLGHHVYVLATPLQPGDSLRLDFRVRYAPRGFTHRGVDASVAANGSYFTQAWLPDVGYRSGRELRGAGERQAHGLPPRPAIRPLEDIAARHDPTADEWIDFAAIVGTDEGQIAVAPGALRRTWTEDGRRYFEYATEVPIRNDYAFFSADYARREARWNDVVIEILHHPDHAWNVERMVASVQASLEYFTEEFGPYPHGQIRLVEHPGDERTLHAYPVNISYDEGFSILHPDDDPRDVDFPFGVVAHEVAHQWWGNQLSPANVEGAPLLTESLAWYSAMGVVEATHGAEHLRRFLGVLRHAYLAPRRRADVPLLRARDWFQAYRKGPFAMYALREYVGEERVNLALRRMIEEYGSGGPPLPTSLDLYRELHAVTPDSLRYLLVDLFETNTYWDFEIEGAVAEPAQADGWRVTLDLWAGKIAVDSAGTETVVPMVDDRVEIGVYGATRDGQPGEPLYRAMHRVRSGEQLITVTVPEEPARVAIDPRRLLIELRTNDNTAQVTCRACGLRIGNGAAPAPE